MAEAKREEGMYTIDEQKFDMDFTGQHIVTVTDRSGHSMKYQLFRGVHLIPMYKVEILQQIQGFCMRSDDIYITGFPRTGTNWTFEMTSMLLNGKAETIQRAKDLMELTPPVELAQRPSPRVINAHTKMSHSPDDVATLKCKVIFTLRDPKDAALSLYKLIHDRPMPYGRYQGSFGDYLHLYLDGKVENNGIFEHWRDAEDFFSNHPDIPVHFQCYEDAMKVGRFVDEMIIALKQFYLHLVKAYGCFCCRIIKAFSFIRFILLLLTSNICANIQCQFNAYPCVCACACACMSV
ncbi:sulfotransferase 1A1-like isoform X3 [Haliotis asinina]|uniref:sulfotransferase 1A1-like isoform X3 n=1 Tax=Haliotis asinina TaxID=109174 RepID=UPI003531E962